MKRVPFNDLVREFSGRFTVSETLARRYVRALFDAIRTETLERGSNVSIPDFGTFRRVKTKGGFRLVCGVKTKVDAGKRIAFRMAKNLR